MSSFVHRIFTEMSHSVVILKMKEQEYFLFGIKEHIMVSSSVVLCGLLFTAFYMALYAMYGIICYGTHERVA